MKRCLVAALVAVALVVVAMVGGGAAAEAKPADPPYSARAAGTDYYYAAAYDYVDAPVAGFQASFTVHKPRQVVHRHRHHSLGQIGVSQRIDGSYLEAGWIVERGKPRLFVYWRPASGRGTCYNVGCGFRVKGPGKRPGTPLKVGSSVTIGFEHVGKKWWLLVNGKRSGYYSDRLWKGRFTGTDFAQVWGEVSVDRGAKVCTDMGNGQRPESGQAALIYDVAWIGGPPVVLTPSTANDPTRYGLALLAPNAVAYGGPGDC